MNPLTFILDLFKHNNSEASANDKHWMEGRDAFEKGEALAATGQIQDALACFDIALSHGYDGYGRAYGHRGSCLQSLEFHLDAIDDFNKAIVAESHDSNLYFMRSISKGATGDLVGCNEDLHEAIRVARTHSASNTPHDAYAKEKGYEGIVAFYEARLLFSQLDLERQASDERIRRDNPEHAFGPDLVTQRRAKSRRRPT